MAKAKTKTTKKKKPAPKKKPAKKKKKAPKPRPAPRPQQPVDLAGHATRMGRTCAEIMTLEGENTKPDADELNDWADQWFVNNGSFDGFPGDIPDDDAARSALRRAFMDSFITTMKARLAL